MKISSNSTIHKSFIKDIAQAQESNSVNGAVISANEAQSILENVETGLNYDRVRGGDKFEILSNMANILTSETDISQGAKALLENYANHNSTAEINPDSLTMFASFSSVAKTASRSVMQLSSSLNEHIRTDNSSSKSKIALLKKEINDIKESISENSDRIFGRFTATPYSDQEKEINASFLEGMKKAINNLDTLKVDLDNLQGENFKENASTLVAKVENTVSLLEGSISSMSKVFSETNKKMKVPLHPSSF